MLKPSAIVSQIVEESDGHVVQGDMNSVQEPQSENHDMDQLPMSNIVGPHNVDLLDDLLDGLLDDNWIAATSVMQDIIFQVVILPNGEDIGKSYWLI